MENHTVHNISLIANKHKLCKSRKNEMAIIMNNMGNNMRAEGDSAKSA